MSKVLVLGLIALLVASCIGFYETRDSIDEETTEQTNSIPIYQGPVPQGQNLEHFRKTGEIIPEDSR